MLIKISHTTERKPKSTQWKIFFQLWYKLCCIKKGMCPKWVCQSIDSCQPAQSAQAEMDIDGDGDLPSSNFSACQSACQRIILTPDSVNCLTKWIFMDP